MHPLDKYSLQTVEKLLKSSCDTKRYAIEKLNELRGRIPPEEEAIMILLHIAHQLLKDFNENYDMEV